MPYKGIVLGRDGVETMYLQFDDRDCFLRWQQTMTNLNQEADRIIASNPEGQNLTSADVNALRDWIRQVDELVAAQTPVLPDILRTRISFTEAISHH